MPVECCGGCGGHHPRPRRPSSPAADAADAANHVEDGRATRTHCRGDGRVRCLVEKAEGVWMLLLLLQLLKIDFASVI